MKSLYCNQINIFINLKIIGEEKLYIHIYIYICMYVCIFLKNLKKKKSAIW